MALVRTNITLPEETLALVDAVAGPRGRSRYIAEVVVKQVRRDNARLVWEKYAGALKGSKSGARHRRRPSRSWLRSGTRASAIECCGHRMRKPRMRYLIDTTLLIDHGLGLPAAAALVRQLFSEPNDLLVCDVVVAEALSSGSEDDIQAIHALLAALEYVSTHPAAAEWAGASRRRLGTSRRRLGDAIIAGVAWHSDAIVVTRNPKDFEVQGVRVLGYA
jgi:predicted nucleic acid-binding protein